MTTEPPPESFASRVRRGKLGQWAFAYLAGAWLLLQFSQLMAETFAWPLVIQRILTVVAAVGLLGTLVLAWYHGARGEQRVRGMELAIFAVLALGVGIGVTLVRGAKGLAAPTPPEGVPFTRPDEASLAILPFTNLSSDPENAYFASGIHDELLTQMSRIPGLRVISRTSVLRYGGTAKSVSEIASELGVAAIMEGSVQRVGNRVLITAQLIDPATESHLWADRYDRLLTDVFEVQNEVARAVAAALRTTFTPGQAALLGRRPTMDGEAYAFYLRGIDYLRRSYREEDLRTGGRMFQGAVELDPDFAEAWAGLSLTENRLYWFGFEPTRSQLERARGSAEKAYALAPELPGVQSAMAEVRYRAREYDRALEFAQPLVSEHSGSADAALLLALIYRRQGRWDDALRLFQRVVELDPVSWTMLYELAITYAVLHRFADAEAALLRSIEVAPDDSPNSYLQLGSLYLWWQGDLSAARRAITRIPDRFMVERALNLALLDAAEGRDQDALDRIESVPASARITVATPGFGVGASPTELINGYLLDRLGRAGEARVRYRAAADTLEAIVGGDGFAEQGQVPYRSALALAYAGLGLKELAISTAEQSIRDLPVSIDALYGPRRLADAAKVYATLGERDRAVAALRPIFATPTEITAASLRLDPLLAPLRGYPPFERLMREHEPG